MFNRKNITPLNATATVDANGNITTPPTLLPTSTVLEKRIVQFGVRVDWQGRPMACPAAKDR